MLELPHITVKYLSGLTMASRSEVQYLEYNNNNNKNKELLFEMS